MVTTTPPVPSDVPSDMPSDVRGTTTTARPSERPTDRPSEPSTGRPPAPGGARLHAIDGLRFAAALGVVVYHFTALGSTVWGEDPGERFPVLGRIALYFSIGPELFFVVSGFVVLWTAWGRTVPQVVASRVARVFPAYWTALALTSALLLLVWPEGKRISPGEVAVNVTLLQEPLGVRHVDGVYWTLWAELRFYLLVAVLVAVGVTRRRVIAFATVWPVLAVVVDRLGWDLAGEILISRYAPFFAGGMLLFLIHRDGHSRLLWTLVGATTVLGVVTNTRVKVGELTTATSFVPDAAGVALALAACFALVALVSVTPLRRLHAPRLERLGALTYPLYLVHLMWGWWFIAQVGHALPTAVTLVAAVAFTLVLAVGVHAIERRTNPPARRALQRALERGAGRLRLRWAH